MKTLQLMHVMRRDSKASTYFKREREFPWRRISVKQYSKLKTQGDAQYLSSSTDERYVRFIALVELP